MEMNTNNYDVIVMGGGPAGSTVASILSREGRTVVLFEKEQFPRHHIGESLMTDTFWTFQRMGLLEKLKQSPFVRKYSVQFANPAGKESRPFYFFEANHHESAVTWQVTRAVFDLAEQRWIVHTSQGTFTARFLINGNGYFSEPYVPRFPGADTFEGEIVHTAALDDRRTFSDKHVVLVGSGSTAVCAAPALAPPVSRSLVLLQRSPTYIYEISNVADRLTRLCQALHARGVTAPLTVLRYYLQARDDLIFVGFRRFPRLARWIFRKTLSTAALIEFFLGTMFYLGVATTGNIPWQTETAARTCCWARLAARSRARRRRPAPCR